MEDDELRKNNYSKWWLKHDDARLAKRKQEAEEEERERREMKEQEKQEEDDADFWNHEDGEEDEEEESSQTYLAGVRMEQIKTVDETDRIGRRYDLDGDLIPEPEPDFWTTGEVKDLPPQMEEERRIRVDRTRRKRDRRERERRDQEVAKAWIEDEDVEMTIDEGGELDIENADGGQEDEDVEMKVHGNESDATDPDMWLRRSR